MAQSGIALSSTFLDTEKMVLNEKNGDFINQQDGLIYCGLCKMPKQQLISRGGSIRKESRNCACGEEAIQKETLKQKAPDHKLRVSVLREQAFEDSLLLEQTFENEDGSLENKKIGLNYVNLFEEMEKENIGLLFTGPVGTGKTYLASCIANALIEREISVKMTNFSVILNDMMSLDINKNKYIASLNKHRLLIIDDFGMERDTPFATEHIFNIIDSRYRKNKPLIITTNRTISQLTAQESLKEQRICSRILEMAIPILFTGENKRIAKMKEKVRIVNRLLIEGRNSQ